MGIELVQGRSFSDEDDERSRPVAIVNQRLAGMLWPGQAAIGRRFRPVARSGRWIEVVGVVATGKYQFLFEDAQPYFYLPIAQEYTGLRVLQVRTSVAPESVRPAVERAIGAREPNLPLYDIQSMAQALGSGPGLFPARVGAVAIATFGLLAFALAIVGLYGLVSYLASQRSHEIGVRMAVGATSRDVVRLVLRDGLAIVLCGLAAGLAMALGFRESSDTSCSACPRATRSHSLESHRLSAAWPCWRASFPHGGRRAPIRWSRCARNERLSIRDS